MVSIQALLNDPVFGSLTQGTGKPQVHTKSKKSSSFSVNAQQNPDVTQAPSKVKQEKVEATCVLCNNSHTLYSCEQFRSLTAQE